MWIDHQEPVITTALPANATSRSEQRNTLRTTHDARQITLSCNDSGRTQRPLSWHREHREKKSKSTLCSLFSVKSSVSSVYLNRYTLFSIVYPCFPHAFPIQRAVCHLSYGQAIPGQLARSRQIRTAVMQLNQHTWAYITRPVISFMEWAQSATRAVSRRNLAASLKISPYGVALRPLRERNDTSRPFDNENSLQTEQIPNSVFLLSVFSLYATATD